MRIVQNMRVGAGMMRNAFIWMLMVVVWIAGTRPAMATVDVPGSARGEGAFQDGEAHVDVRLIYDHKVVKPGDTLRVGVLFSLDQDWHIYWENPGDAGLPTQIVWKGEGLEFGPLQWSAPGLYSESEGMWTTFGYDGEVVLYSDVVVQESVGDSIEIVADIDYLACKNACVPGEHTLRRTLAVGPTSVRAEKSERALFDVYSLQIPRDASALGIKAVATAGASQTDGREGRAVLEVVLCEGPGNNCPEMEISYEQLAYAFVPTSKSSLGVRVLAVEPHPTVYRGWVLSLETRRLLAAHGDSEADAPRLSGVLRFMEADGGLIPVSIDTTVEGATAANSMLFEALFQGAASQSAVGGVGAGKGAASGESSGLLYVLVMAFLGGMILNLMPCVFPVLAIKVTSFMELAHKTRSGVVQNGAAYTAGISASMLTLGLIVVGLRLAGQQVGWGFQFQQPMFLAGLAAVIVLFAMNTFGLFQVTLDPGKLGSVGTESSGLSRSFGEGILAVVLATPCSAPFLGTAVGFALTASAWSIVLIFFVLGLGLAAPFVALTLIPGASKILPRPGEWMNYLKNFLGFALLGAGIWLVWLVGRLAGVDAMGRMLVLLGALSLSAWIFGLVQFRSWGRAKLVGLVLAFGILGGAAKFALPLETGELVGNSGSGGLRASDDPVAWNSWNQENIDAELEAGRPVFVVFTADWCLTCKVNERTAIFDDAVLAAIDTYNIAMLKADWTRPDEAIRAELSKYGRGGVPMYLLYTPSSAGTPEVLPEVLTAGMLIERFERAAALN